MRRYLAGFALSFFIAAASAVSAAEPIEVGYIEYIKGNSAAVVLMRAGKPEPVAICGLVYNGDVVSVSDPKSKVVLRLSGMKEPVEIGADKGTFTIKVDVPRRGFATGLVRWAAASIGDLDRKARAPVAMSVRNGPEGALAAPLLDGKQMLADGTRSLRVGWRGAASIAEVKLSNSSGEVVASGRGTARAWTSPPIALAPGKYRIEIATPREHVSGLIEVLPSSSLPRAPADLSDDALPAALQTAVRATWLAGQSPSYALEAYQLVAGEAGRMHPAGVVADALLRGEQIRQSPRP